MQSLKGYENNAYASKSTFLELDFQKQQLGIHFEIRGIYARGQFVKHLSSCIEQAPFQIKRLKQNLV